jgi:hypothetical protein
MIYEYKNAISLPQKYELYFPINVNLGIYRQNILTLHVFEHTLTFTGFLVNYITYYLKAAALLLTVLERQ